MTKRARGSRKAGTKKNGMIEFNFGNVEYHIDPGRRKVYHRWVEVETAKTCLIMSAYCQSQQVVGAKKLAV